MQQQPLFTLATGLSDRNPMLNSGAGTILSRKPAHISECKTTTCGTVQRNASMCLPMFQPQQAPCHYNKRINIVINIRQARMQCTYIVPYACTVHTCRMPLLYTIAVPLSRCVFVCFFVCLSFNSTYALHRFAFFISVVFLVSTVYSSHRQTHTNTRTPSIVQLALDFGAGCFDSSNSTFKRSRSIDDIQQAWVVFDQVSVCPYEYYPCVRFRFGFLFLFYFVECFDCNGYFVIEK